MRRIEVADNMWVVDYEASIGGEGYDPPQPKRQIPADAEVRSDAPVIVGDDIEQRHREWVRSEGWKVASHTAIAATNQE